MILTLKFERKDMPFIFTSSLPLTPGRNYAMVLCNDFTGNLLVLFWSMCRQHLGKTMHC